MIYFLKGTIENMGDDFLALDVSGVGYHVFASSKFLASVDVGEALKVYIYTNHSEQHGTTLYGFKSENERSLFETLTSVSGAGAKVGLAILSALTVDEIVGAIAAGDGKMLARAKGVGPKLGERLVRELAGKMGAFGTITGYVSAVKSGSVSASSLYAGPVHGVQNEVVSALTNLGYSPMVANKGVGAALAKIGEDAPFDVLFKQSLQELR